MKDRSVDITKRKLCQIAEIQSGIYIKGISDGDVSCLQVKDLLMDSPETTAMKTNRTKKIDRYLLKKGDILFACKGTTYLCKVFDYDIPAVASTTLYSIRLQTNIITPEYLCWYMNHPTIAASINNEKMGTGSPMIRKEVIENLEVMIPDMNTQKTIIEISKLQERENELVGLIQQKKTQLTNQLIINKLNI
ncbi:MAG: restriction endonuclease subunit S [Bacteroidales bacterium]|nr:restriction endonuclease subunit S [Bacteroidales bacterium]